MNKIVLEEKILLQYLKDKLVEYILNSDIYSLDKKKIINFLEIGLYDNELKFSLEQIFGFDKPNKKIEEIYFNFIHEIVPKYFKFQKSML